MTKEERNVVKIERMAYVKDKVPSWLALLAILANVLFFVSIYKTNVSYYYTHMIGVSVIVNLLFMLATFLCSEGVKAYKKAFGITMIVLGAIEVSRIFVFPLQGITSVESTTNEPVMATAQFIRVVIYLAAAAGLLIAGGIISIRNSTILNNSLKEKENKK